MPIVTLDSITTPHTNGRTAASHRASFSHILSKVAKDSLHEGIVTAASVGVGCLYASPIGAAGFVVLGVATLAANIFFRTVQLEIAKELPGISDEETKRSYLRGHYISRLCAPLCLSVLDLVTRATLVHEWGHATFTHLFFANAHTKISLNPFLGGLTLTNWRGLSPLGKKLGYGFSESVMVAAGPAFGIALACTDIIAAHCFKKSHPKLSMHLNSHAIINIFNHVLYALSALVYSSNGHDFAYLMAKGIHPIVASAVMIAIPLALKLLLIKCSNRSHD